jgi:hypothetical protein
MKKCYAAVCTMVKDELDLREWVAYHLAVGFDHLLVYDNESRLPVSVLLGDFVAAGVVTVLRVQGRFQQCRTVYVDALERARGRADWMAFIDADEFILPHATDDIREYLAAIEKYAAVGLNWQIFGDAHHIARPQGQLIESYTLRGETDYEENKHVKSIVKPSETLWPGNPHCFHMRDRRLVVDGDGEMMPVHPRHHQAFCFPPAVSKIQINHYYTRSLEDFRMKQNRGGGAGVERRSDEVFEIIQSKCNVVRDDRIARFASSTAEHLPFGHGARKSAT